MKINNQPVLLSGSWGTRTRTKNVVRETRTMVVEFNEPQPDRQPNKIIKSSNYEQKLKEIGQPKLLLITNKKRKIYSSASIEVNPM
jgi:hypothetical protein